MGVALESTAADIDLVTGGVAVQGDGRTPVHGERAYVEHATEMGPRVTGDAQLSSARDRTDAREDGGQTKCRLSEPGIPDRGSCGDWLIAEWQRDAWLISATIWNAL